MSGQSLENRIIAISVKVYQVFLRAYPTKFQQEYGSQMIQVFRDCCRHAFRQSGARGIYRLWAVTVLDFLHSVFEQHMQKEADLSQSRLIKWSGWAFILGAFAFLTFVGGSEALTLPGSELSAILLAVGLLGLRARYGEHVGSFGRNILLLGASGPFLLVIVIAMWLAGIITEAQITKGLWILLFGGPAISLLGLTLFGVVALRSRPMSRWYWLPVVTGIWYPVAYLFLEGYLFTHEGVYPQEYHSAIQTMLLIQCLALCLLGFIVLTDSRQEWQMRDQS
jgi:hypothetical protein